MLCIYKTEESAFEFAIEKMLLLLLFFVLEYFYDVHYGNALKVFRENPEYFIELNGTVIGNYQGTSTKISNDTEEFNKIDVLPSLILKRTIRSYDTINGNESANKRIHEKNQNVHEYEKIKREYIMFDSEWDDTFYINNYTVPNVVMNLYESINQHDVVEQVDLIRCFLVSEYLIKSNGLLIKFNASSRRNMEEKIIRSELYVFRHLEALNHNNSIESRIIRLFQVSSSDEIEENVDFHKLLGIIYLSANVEGWQTFNVETALETWQRGKDVLNFLISVTDTRGNIIKPNYFGLGIKQPFAPFLVLHMRQLLFEQFKAPISTNDLQRNQLEIHNFSSCTRHIHNVNFEEAGFINIIHPKSVELYNCVGTCDLGIESYTNHAKLLKINKNINGSCVPDEYLAIKLMFYSFGGRNIVIKTYYNMIVKSCGCR